MSRPRSERPRVTAAFSHLMVMLIVSVVLGVVVAGLAIPFAGVLGFAARSTAESMDNLPQELETSALPQKTTIVDSQGNEIASVFDENRINVSLRQVNRRMVKALLSIEDFRFYEHGALDFRGTLRALFTNAAANGVVQGGSTITQQLVKLSLLQEAGNDKEKRAEFTADTYARKLAELRYAIALEKKHSKDWILERYLNIAYFGDGAYGVQAAARHYFNVNARKLNLNQSATLAGLVQNPSGFDPTNYRDRAIERRDVVLDRMARLNVVSEAKVDKINARGLQLDIQPANNGCIKSAAPFFCEYALSYLKFDKALGKNQEERERLIYSGGLTIETTLDLDYQDAADTAVQENVNPRDTAIGALAMVEAGTGAVKAIAQSRPMGGNEKRGESFLNFVVPSRYGDSNGFQAGSTFKVFVLATAIEDQIPLDRVYNSPDVKTFDQSDFDNCPGEPPFAGTFDTPNSTEGGLENLYTGTRDSVNTFYMQLEQDTGVCEPFKLARQMGIKLTDPEGKQGLPERVPNFTLGVANVSPLEMAEAYATFAARGVHCDSRPVTAIRDMEGNLLKEYPNTCTRVMEESTADAVSDVLRGVIEGGFASAQALDQPAAGKTGTTNEGRSVWFVGYTPQIASAAMIAGYNAAGQPIPLAGQTIGDVYRPTATGSGFAGPIWGRAMMAIDDGLDNVDFVFPEGIEGAGQDYVPAPTPPPTQPDRGGGRGGRGGRR